MNKLFATVAVLMLTNVSIFSQTKFPAKIQFENDTVVAITIPQMDAISERLIDCQRLSLADSLIDAKSTQNKELTALTQIQREQISELNSNVTDLTDLSDIQTQISKNKDLLLSDQKRKNRRNLLIGLPVGISFSVVAGLFIGIFAVR